MTSIVGVTSTFSMLDLNSLNELHCMFREGQDIAKEFVQLLEDQKTLTVLDQVRFAKK